MKRGTRLHYGQSSCFAAKRKCNWAGFFFSSSKPISFTLDYLKNLLLKLATHMAICYSYHVVLYIGPFWPILPVKIGSQTTEADGKSRI